MRRLLSRYSMQINNQQNILRQGRKHFGSVISWILGAVPHGPVEANLSEYDYDRQNTTTNASSTVWRISIHSCEAASAITLDTLQETQGNLPLPLTRATCRPTDPARNYDCTNFCFVASKQFISFPSPSKTSIIPSGRFRYLRQSEVSRLPSDFDSARWKLLKGNPLGIDM